jgi:hypothetical protein
MEALWRRLVKRCADVTNLPIESIPFREPPKKKGFFSARTFVGALNMVRVSRDIGCPLGEATLKSAREEDWRAARKALRHVGGAKLESTTDEEIRRLMKLLLFASPESIAREIAADWIGRELEVALAMRNISMGLKSIILDAAFSTKRRIPEAVNILERSQPTAETAKLLLYMYLASCDDLHEACKRLGTLNAEMHGHLSTVKLPNLAGSK